MSVHDFRKAITVLEMSKPHKEWLKAPAVVILTLAVAPGVASPAPAAIHSAPKTTQSSCGKDLPGPPAPAPKISFKE